MKNSILKLIAIVFILASCSKDDGENTTPALTVIATSINLVSDDNQTAEVSTTLLNTVEILVNDQNGDPFAGATVNFSVNEGSLSTATATTNTNGMATVLWTLGASAGTQTLTVTGFKADGTTPLTNSPLSVTATATTEPLFAESITPVISEIQTAIVETTLTNALEVLVNDQNGEPFAGATVSFTVVEGSLSEATATTNTNGIASVVWTLGATVGIQTLMVTGFKADGITPLTNSPISLTARAVPLVATSITLVSGGDQTATTGETLTNLIEIQVNDQNGNPFTGPGITTTFSVTEGILNLISTANGLRTASWRLGASIGIQTLTVAVFKTDGNTPLTNSPLIVTATAIQPILVGEFKHGGVVFYVDQTGEHGLVCAVNDLSMAEWGCMGTEITGADRLEIGRGSQNTLDILAGCATTGIAADICTNLDLNGFSDWFLPSRNTLNEMYINKDAINATATGNGGTEFVNDAYWSSTEYNANPSNQVHGRNFDTGTIYVFNKVDVRYVRPVRAF